VLLVLVSSGAISSPKTSYLLHCGGCHLPDGRGVPPEVPSLRNELGKLIQIPGGRDYLVRVPGASQAPISDRELAQVLNYVLREFNRETLSTDFTPLGAEEVSKSRPHILADPLKYRARLWADYN
jgi:mono/diheme cytochrome c family protein